PEEASEINGVIQAEAGKEQQSVLAAIEKTDELLQPLEEKLRKLTRCLLDGIIDEDSYRIAKEDLILEKTRLKQERQRLNKSRESCWIEPTRDLANALEILG